MGMGVAVRQLVLLVLASMAAVAHAQTWPNKPIHWTIPYPPGGASDVTARVLGQKMTESWGQPVLIENRVGANGIVALDYVAKSAPDGYNILMANLGPNAINPAVYSKLPFDAVRDFAPVTLTTLVPQVVVVSAGFEGKTFREFLAIAKASPGKLTYATGGNGSANQLAGELLKTMAGINIVHVPYKGDAPAMQDVIGGQITLTFPTVISASPHVKSGKLRPLAVTTLKRVPTMPDVPTIAESGVPGYDVASWGGVMVPAGTPPAVIDKLHGEIVRILKLPDVRERIASFGAEIVGSTPAEFGAFVNAEITKWAAVAKSAGIKLD